MPVIHHVMKTSNHTIPDRSPPGSTRTACAFRRTPRRRCQVCYWCIVKDSWKRQHHHRHKKRKDQELTHKLDWYRGNILELCEMRWKNFGETTTEEGHEVFFSGKEDRHEHGVGFLVHKDIVNTVMGCRPVSNRLIAIRLRAVPFNITIVQVYAPTSDYDDNEIEEFYDQLQNVIDQTPKKVQFCCARRPQSLLL